MSSRPPLFRLTPSQIHVLMLLDDGPDEDSVGLEFDQFLGSHVTVAKRLREMGLVETHFGWRFTLWFRLTVKGRILLRTGVR
jgi:hypothetical protein